MHLKGFIKLIFFFLILERLITLITILPHLNQMHTQVWYNAYNAGNWDQLFYSLIGPFLNVVVMIVLIVIVLNERILNKLSNWLAKD